MTDETVDVYVPSETSETGFRLTRMLADEAESLCRRGEAFEALNLPPELAFHETAHEASDEDEGGDHG